MVRETNCGSQSIADDLSPLPPDESMKEVSVPLSSLPTGDSFEVGYLVEHTRRHVPRVALGQHDFRDFLE